ncbi:MAG TPA: protein translocase subunit SecD, partial [Roseomonas sp.]|nr:protein translocase subunit SecD [Roseomonas sp.]
MILAVCLVGTLVAMMNLAPRSAFPGWFPARQISLGLDLRGGSYLLLEVDLNTVVRERLDGMIEGARTRLRTANVRYVNLAADAANRRMGLRVLDAAQLPAAATALRELANPVQLATGQNLPDIEVTTTPDGQVW